MTVRRIEKPVVDRVQKTLASLGAAFLTARGQGGHIVIDRENDAVARLTELGRDAFGLAFRGPAGWEPMVLVDTLEEIVSDVTVALAPA